MTLGIGLRGWAAGVTWLLASVVVCASPAPAQPREARSVLTIHWGAENFPGTAALDAGIKQALESRADAPVNYFTEYLESEDFPASLEPLRDYIRQKYSGRRIDLVIAVTTPALEFVLDHRDALFPDVPVVFVAGAVPEALASRKVPGVTGFLSDAAFQETLELALALHRSVKRVFVVAQVPTTNEYTEQVLAALRRFSGRVELTPIREPSVPGLLAAIKAIPPSSLILYTRYMPTDTLSVANTVEVARLTAQVSPVPVYSTAAVYMGTGVIGGVMREPGATGTRLGEIARRILEGTRPEDIPIQKADRVPTFDWNQVRRWGIDPGRLPRGSRIHFYTPTVWETYRWYIVGTVVVVIAQFLLIGGLLTQHARRRRAEATIRAREATLQTSYTRIRQLAARLINAQEVARASVARDLHDDVCQQLVYVSMGVGALKGSSGSTDDQEVQKTLADVERGITHVFDSVRRLSHELHPATLRWLGLAAALKGLCLEVEKRHNIRVSFKTEEDLGKVHEDVAVAVFRIAQEALRNGIVHGHAQRFDVSLARSRAGVELTVTDDGSGFDLEAVRRKNAGLGLVSIVERAHVLGGEAHIDAAIGRGTTVRVWVPAEPPVEDTPDDSATARQPLAVEFFAMPLERPASAEGATPHRA